MELKLEDIKCPACFEILVQPVTTPCKHTVCLDCIKKTFENNKYNCLVCRKFLGSWLRRSKSKNCLVDAVLWNTIQQRFGSLVTKRLNNEEYDMPTEIPNIILSEPGEVGKEFIESFNAIQTELSEIEEKAYKNSLRLIEEIQAEEEEENKRIEEDEKIARALMKEENAKFIATASTPKSSTVPLSVAASASKIFPSRKTSNNGKSIKCNTRKPTAAHRRLILAADRRRTKTEGSLDNYLRKDNLVSNECASSSTADERRFPLTAEEINNVLAACNNESTNDEVDGSKCTSLIDDLIEAEKTFLRTKEIIESDYRLTKKLQRTVNSCEVSEKSPIRLGESSKSNRKSTGKQLTIKQILQQNKAAASSTSEMNSKQL